MERSDNQLLQVLMSNYAELLSFIRARFGDKQFAQEVMQETCLHVLEKKHVSLDQVNSPLALLKTISLHLAIDLYRRSKRTDEHLNIDTDVLDWVDDDQRLTGPELLIAQDQFEEKIMAAIQALPPVCQDVFILMQFYHMSQVEIAEQMGISRGMVVKHLARALKVLIPFLFDEHE